MQLSFDWEQRQPEIEVPKMSKHVNGQWYIKSKGKMLYFGSNYDLAGARAILWKFTGIRASRHLLKDFALQYISKVGYPTFDDTYIAAWTAQRIEPYQMVETVGDWLRWQDEFREDCNGDRVYVIEDSQGDVKIGYAKDVRSRFSCLQTAHKNPLKLLCSLPGGRQHENELHVRFRDYRLGGEWFKREGEVDSFVSMATAIEAF